MKKNIIIVILLFCIIALSLSSILFSRDKNGGGKVTINKEIPWTIKYGNEFDNSMYEKYSRDIECNITFDWIYNNANYLYKVPYFKEQKLMYMNQYSLGNQSKDLSINFNAMENVSSTDLAKDVYNLYKDISKNIVVYEKKIGDIVYILERNVANGEDEFYEERLLINKVYSDEDTSSYSFVQYLILDSTFSDDMIDEIIDNFEINKKGDSFSNYCNSNERRMDCEFTYEGENKLTYIFDTLKYAKYSVNKVSPVPITFQKKDNSTAVNIELKYNDINSVVDERIITLEDTSDLNIIKGEITIDGKQFMVINYDSPDYNGKEYFYSLSDVVTLYIKVESDGEYIDDVINDFTNFSTK